MDSSDKMTEQQQLDDLTNQCAKLRLDDLKNQCTQLREQLIDAIVREEKLMGILQQLVGQIDKSPDLYAVFTIKDSAAMAVAKEAVGKLVKTEIQKAVEKLFQSAS